MLGEIAEEVERRGVPGAVMVTSNGLYPEYDFQRIDALADREQTSPEKMVGRILEKTEACAKAIYFLMHEDAVRHIMLCDFVGVGTEVTRSTLTRQRARSIRTVLAPFPGICERCWIPP